MHLRVFKEAEDLILSVPNEDSARILTALELLKADRPEELTIKRLRGKIQEVVVRQYRLVFFRSAQTIYVVDAFKKQSRKTPQRIIKRAENIYRKLSQ